MATLKDVAKDAGVSIATVSCCISGTRYVKPETKMRVMDSIEKLKYIPNASARDLKSSSSNRIGIVLTDIDNTYHAEIFKGVSSYLQRRGYSISVAFSNNLPDIEIEKIEDFISQNVSGLVIITCQPQNTDFFQNRIKNFNIPAVFIERRPDNLDVSFAGFDNNKTLYQITNALLSKNYRKIGLVTGFSHFSSEKESMEGYSAAFQNNELSPDTSLIVETNMTKEDSFKTCMTKLPLTSLQAVIATSESIASGILEALYLQNICVPDDILLITLSEEGWNNATKYPGVIHTSRTAFTLGREAAQILLQNIKEPVLFEEQNRILSDHIPNLNAIPVPASVAPSCAEQDNTQECLRILMVDLVTSHSTKLLSQSFTRETGIPIEFTFVKHDELLKCIMHDVNSSRNYYDIYMYDVPWLEYMVQNAFVSDMTDFVTNSDFEPERLFKQNMDNCKYEEHYYGIPIIGGTQIMFYRQDLFENREIIKSFKKKYEISLRPPRTWTEFNGIAEFFTRKYNPASPTPFGTSFAGIIDEELAPEILIRLWSFGGKIWDKYNRVCLNTPENEKAFHSILTTLNYVEKNPLETSILNTVDDFISGKTAMLVTYTEYASQISQYIHRNTSGRVGYETIPGKTPASVGWNFGLNPFTSKSDMAYRYFNWLCRDSTSCYMTIMDGQSPVITPYHSHELMKLYPWLELTEESFTYCRKRNGPYRNKSLVIPQNKLEAILCSVLRDILINKTSISQALTKAQVKMEELFKSYGYPKPLHFIQ